MTDFIRNALIHQSVHSKVEEAVPSRLWCHIATISVKISLGREVLNTKCPVVWQLRRQRHGSPSGPRPGQWRGVLCPPLPPHKAARGPRLINAARHSAARAHTHTQTHTCESKEANSRESPQVKK